MNMFFLFWYGTNVTDVSSKLGCYFFVVSSVVKPAYHIADAFYSICVQAIPLCHEVMEVASIPWEWVASFLWSHDMLSLRVTASSTLGACAKSMALNLFRLILILLRVRDCMWL